MALTVTQQPQKWHKRRQPGKGSIPSIPVHKLVHVPSARLKKAKSKLSDGFKTGSDLKKLTLKVMLKKLKENTD